MSASLPLRIQLFGQLTVYRGADSGTRFRTQKTAAMLARLALLRDRYHPREELIELFWPDATIEAGQTSLRTALAALRRHLELPGRDENDILIADRSKIRLNSAMVSTDVADFEQCLSRATGADSSEDRAALLERAAEFYRGELLSGFYDDWILTERSRFAQTCCRALRELVALRMKLGETEAAIQAGQRWATLDPEEEEAQLTLCRLLLSTGQRAAARKQFREWERICRDRLEEPLSAAARQLAKEIEAAARMLPRSTPGINSAGLDPPTADLKSPQTISTPKEAHQTKSQTAGREPTQESSLPRSLTRFFGRDEEIRRLQERFLQEGDQLVTLTGPGGIGKTRTALELLQTAEISARFRLWFLGLEELNTGAELIDSLCGLLGLRLDLASSPMAQLAKRLGSAPTLLVLDNFEQLPESCAQFVEELLSRASKLCCLITSRHRLGIAGEQEFPVSPLPVPESSGEISELLESAGLRLFLDRARSTRPDFQITPNNAETLASLCRKLEGIPLAIELAASWASLLTPRQMLDRLELGYRRLEGRKRDLPARHRTLHAAMEWSYALLPAELQQFLIRLSIFRDGWREEEAGQVCETTEPLLLLADLRDRSLIRLSTDSEEANAPRFRMLETIRQFAAERLEESGERARLTRLLCDCFLRLAEEARPQLESGSAAIWFARLEEERQNLNTALAYATTDPDSGETALRLAGALQRFWLVRGHLKEGMDWCRKALEHPGAQKPDRLRGDALTGAGNLSLARRDYAEAQKCYEAALIIRRETEDRQGMAAVLGNLANILSDEGDRKAARQLHQEALTIKRELGYESGQAITLVCLGNLAMDEGDHRSARPLYEEARQLCEKVANRGLLLYVLSSLGDVELLQHEPPLARKHYAAGLRLCLELGDRTMLDELLERMAEIARLDESDQFAVQLLGASNSLREQISSPPDPGQRSRLEAMHTALKTRLGEDRFHLEFASGRKLTPEKAAELALDSYGQPERTSGVCAPES